MKTDEKLWVAFHELHVEPLLDYVDVVWVSPVAAGTHNDDSVIDERADPSDVKADGGAGRCRHTFVLYNPPRRCGRRIEGSHRCWGLDGSRACGCICSEIRLLWRGIWGVRENVMSF